MMEYSRLNFVIMMGRPAIFYVRTNYGADRNNDTDR